MQLKPMSGRLFRNEWGWEYFPRHGLFKIYKCITLIINCQEVISKCKAHSTQIHNINKVREHVCVGRGGEEDNKIKITYL